MGALAGIRTARLVKDNPLPAGSYWLDVFEPNRATWEAWVKESGASVHVAVTEEYEGEPENGYPARLWVQFDVLAPTAWPQAVAMKLGWPNSEKIVPKTSSDTVDKPKLDPWGNVDDGKDSQWGWVKWAVGGAIVVGGIYSVAKLVRG